MPLEVGLGAWLHRLLGSGAEKLRLSSRLAADPVVASLLECIRCEVKGGCASGERFAQGIALALEQRLSVLQREGRRSSQAGPQLLP